MTLYCGFRIEPVGTFPLFVVRARGSGQIPDFLSGTYTTGQQAMKAVDRYLASLTKGKRMKRDEPTESTASS